MADTKYITDEELAKFGEDLKGYVLQAMETEETNFAGVVKEYVEGQVAGLEAKLVNDPKWLQVKQTVQTLLDVFDANKDGSLSPEEVLSKISEIKAVTDEISKRVDGIDTKIADINTQIGGINTEIENVKKSITDTAANAQKAVSDLDSKVAAQVTEIQKSIADNATAASKAVKDLQNKVEADIETAKSALNTEITTQVSGLQSEVKENFGSVIDGIEKAMSDAFKAAQDTVEDRMSKVREIFGLAAKTSSTDSEGDGAAV